MGVWQICLVGGGRFVRRRLRETLTEDIQIQLIRFIRLISLLKNHINIEIRKKDRIEGMLDEN